MVWRYCVPGCTSSARVPGHRLPAQDLTAQNWLKIIGLDNMIDAPQETKAKLRICGLHFCDEMIVTYGQKRRLKTNAVPTLHLPCANIIADSDNTSFADVDTIAILPTSDDVGSTSNFEPQTSQQEVPQVINIKTVHTVDVCRLRKKVRRYQKTLYKKKRIIRKNQKKKRQAEKINTWETITAELPGIKKTFIEMIFQNFRHAPQVCLYFNTKYLAYM
ncbi:PREDICTED: uncharacterized protein LOC105556933 [Vollenhovia emeryi]|uniref:uncharacterized protein LOC105556933 n=1 Tax=Vollenhovia emeryi TaxID=411798 RepID=UPI0005F36E3A|nr:PREDICTED: uncharacterized protein LOC105556933 [Vollenhovia emeryi]